jgi:choline-glycine betaine transporter
MKADLNSEDPPKGVRALWAVSIGALGITLVLMGKGISGLQLSSIIASLIIIPIMLGMCMSMIKSLYREETKPANRLTPLDEMQPTRQPE